VAVVRLESERPPPAAKSDPSSPAEADRDLVPVDDDRDFAPPMREPEHALELLTILLHVDVFDADLAPGVILTGRLRIGSGVFAEDEHHEPILTRCLAFLVKPFT
jgi:hypothetical protein